MVVDETKAILAQKPAFLDSELQVLSSSWLRQANIESTLQSSLTQAQYSNKPAFLSAVLQVFDKKGCGETLKNTNQVLETRK